MHRRDDAIEEVRKMINQLHDSYESIAETDNSQPMMQNAQSVVAGMTYGKSKTLDEAPTDIENRGFRVITLDKNDPDGYETYTMLSSELLENGSFIDGALSKLMAMFERIGDFFEDLWDRITAAFEQ